MTTLYDFVIGVLLVLPRLYWTWANWNLDLLLMPQGQLLIQMDRPGEALWLLRMNFVIGLALYGLNRLVSLVAGQRAAVKHDLSAAAADGRLQAYRNRVRRLERRLAIAEGERNRLRAAAMGPTDDRPTARAGDRPGAAWDLKFKEAKRTFARRFHPNAQSMDGREKEIREALFREFWADLERIERR